LEHDVIVTVELPVMPIDVRISEQALKAEEMYRKALQVLDDAQLKANEIREKALNVLEDARAEAKRIKDEAHYEAIQRVNEASKKSWGSGLA
jgi:F0F1-type ATP synthase membrane subunit b/b'